jgi:hypothetical protein
MDNNGWEIQTCVHFDHDNLDQSREDRDYIHDEGVQGDRRRDQSSEGTYGVEVGILPAFLPEGNNDPAVPRDAAGRACPCAAGIGDQL